MSCMANVMLVSFMWCDLLCELQTLKFTFLSRLTPFLLHSWFLFLWVAVSQLWSKEILLICKVGWKCWSDFSSVVSKAALQSYKNDVSLFCFLHGHHLKAVLWECFWLSWVESSWKPQRKASVLSLLGSPANTDCLKQVAWATCLWLNSENWCSCLKDKASRNCRAYFAGLLLSSTGWKNKLKEKAIFFRDIPTSTASFNDWEEVVIWPGLQISSSQIILSCF